MKKILIAAILASSLFGDCNFWFKKFEEQSNYIALLYQDEAFDQLKDELPLGIDYSRRLMACSDSEKVIEAVGETRAIFKGWLDALEGK